MQVAIVKWEENATISQNIISFHLMKRLICKKLSDWESITGHNFLLSVVDIESLLTDLRNIRQENCYRRLWATRRDVICISRFGLNKFGLNDNRFTRNQAKIQARNFFVIQCESLENREKKRS